MQPKCPQIAYEARKIVAQSVDHYNTKKRHSAIGYVT